MSVDVRSRSPCYARDTATRHGCGLVMHNRDPGGRGPDEAKAADGGGKVGALPTSIAGQVVGRASRALSGVGLDPTPVAGVTGPDPAT
jgi:hypothetical protein